ncbi:hypothetical protein P2G88_15610 [Aliiglaciecola sp. CAU 1673]|uniref:hypothetical protein n=1 Tax=Aliiglaciecola sp. CAU 1673 TaxID=3032595 RepID=UPI0023DAFA24|nr:hypothetical protein [Aliiglaciecola sp. CAU 1673]MDF2179677.1 hypothetical protein [Aliiglaciecola sp. CAU 1673]
MQDNLEQWREVWLEQDVNVPDPAVLQKKWRHAKLKQRLFFMLDLASLLVLIPLIWFFAPQHWFEKAWFAVMFLLALWFTVLNTRLRWQTLSTSSDSTSSYLHSLETQCRNNLKLVLVTRLSLLTTLLAFLIFVSGNWYFDLTLASRGWQNSALMLALVIVILLPWWAWTIRQEKMNQRELLWLQRWQKE